MKAIIYLLKAWFVALLTAFALPFSIGLLAVLTTDITFYQMFHSQLFWLPFGFIMVIVFIVVCAFEPYDE
jgi:hypothetical protein